MTTTHVPDDLRDDLNRLGTQALAMLDQIKALMVEARPLLERYEVLLHDTPDGKVSDERLYFLQEESGHKRLTWALLDIADELDELR